MFDDMHNLFIDSLTDFELTIRVMIIWSWREIIQLPGSAIWTSITTSKVRKTKLR
jgi:hypothetical protein